MRGMACGTQRSACVQPPPRALAQRASPAAGVRPVALTGRAGLRLARRPPLRYTGARAQGNGNGGSGNGSTGVAETPSEVMVEDASASGSPFTTAAAEASPALRGVLNDGVMARWLLELRSNGALVRQAVPISDVGKEHVFGKADWGQHRDAGRYWRHIVTMTRSRTVAALVAPTFFCLAQTAVVGAYSTLHAASLPDIPPVGQEFFNLTSGALALLLVFRTDASYTRWDEARRQWGEFIFHGRNVVRISIDAFAASGQEPRACALIKWTVAFGVLLKLHLREDTKREALERELGAWLSMPEITMLAASRHKPNAALQVMSRLARDATPSERAQLEVCLSAFSETLGRCERISRVPIPLSYTRHTSRFLIAWLVLLPFGCWTAMGWDALLFAPLTAFLLFGVDQIGVDLENPFSVLPLDVLANKLKLDAADMVAQSADVGRLAEAAAVETSLEPAWRKHGGMVAEESRAAALASRAPRLTW